MNIDEMNLVMVDCEATSDTPMTGVMTEFGAVHYHTREHFHGRLYDSVPDPANPARPVAMLTTARDAWQVMGTFTAWLASFPGRPVFVSDNNGYDAMWISCLFDSCAMPNPFGHSSRRISDFYAGLLRDFSQTQRWKRWRITPHSHHPVDDAQGNCEAFAMMLAQFPANGT